MKHCQHMQDSPYEDEDVQKVLGNMKKIAEKRKEASDVKVSIQPQTQPPRVPH